MKRFRFRVFKKILNANGFVLQRSRGSHRIFKNVKGDTIIIPDNGSKPISCVLTRKVIKDHNITL